MRFHGSEDADNAPSRVQVLGRNFTSPGEYEDAVLSLPPRIYGAAGPRCSFVTTVAGSAEFSARVCPAALGRLPQAVCTVRALYPAILLVSPTAAYVNQTAALLVSGTLTPASLASELCAEADAAGLYNQTSTPV